ncbi:MAG TPA: hypothetical protein VG056_06260 [Pirellulales bacterium]|nr:hypothetical protein [Pirellulales bacterium]
MYWFLGDGKRFAARKLLHHPAKPGGAEISDPLPLFRTSLIELAG